MSFMDFISEWAPKWPFPSAVEQAETYSLFIVCAGGSMTFALDFCACTEDEAKLAFNDMLLLDIEREEKGLPKDGTFSMFLAQTRHVVGGQGNNGDDDDSDEEQGILQVHYCATISMA